MTKTFFIENLTGFSFYIGQNMFTLTVNELYARNWFFLPLNPNCGHRYSLFDGGFLPLSTDGIQVMYTNFQPGWNFFHFDFILGLHWLNYIDVWWGIWRCTHAKLAPVTPHLLTWDRHNGPASRQRGECFGAGNLSAHISSLLLKCADGASTLSLRFGIDQDLRILGLDGKLAAGWLNYICCNTKTGMRAILGSHTE